jgi:hypothetical protein
MTATAREVVDEMLSLAASLAVGTFDRWPHEG